MSIADQTKRYCKFFDYLKKPMAFAAFLSCENEKIGTEAQKSFIVTYATYCENSDGDQPGSLLLKALLVNGLLNGILRRAFFRCDVE